jgi:hypothetical protein
MAIAPAAQGYLFDETCSRNSYFFRWQRDDRDIRYTGCPGNISRPVSIPSGLVHVEQNISGGFSKATPHIHSTNPKDGVFGDICSVIRNTLEIAGDANRPRAQFGTALCRLALAQAALGPARRKPDRVAIDLQRRR